MAQTGHHPHARDNKDKTHRKNSLRSNPIGEPPCQWSSNEHQCGQWQEAQSSTEGIKPQVILHEEAQVKNQRIEPCTQCECGNRRLGKTRNLEETRIQHGFLILTSPIMKAKRLTPPTAKSVIM